MRSQGRINSDKTERSYRGVLEKHAQDVENRDPRYIGREDIKRTLTRWKHPNSQATCRAILVSYYDWLMEEGFRKDNPARQTRRPRRRKPEIYRLTRDEVEALLDAASTSRERRVVFIGVCAGLRRQELLGLQGRHFQRDGYVWVSSDIAKGRRERWVPVIAELEPVAAEIRDRVAADEYVLPAQRWRDPGINRERADKLKHPSSEQAIWRLVGLIGQRAGIAAPVKPHMLRHAFADFTARYAGIRNAQFLLGHANVGTTEGYLGAPTLDELTAAISGFSYGAVTRTDVLPLRKSALTAAEATTGVEPVLHASRPVAALRSVLEGLWASPVLRAAVRD